MSAQRYLLVILGLQFSVLILFTEKEKPDEKDMAKETASRLKSGDSLLVSTEHVDAQEFSLL